MLFKNKNMITITMFSLVCSISMLAISCTDFNLFAWDAPDLSDIFKNSSIDEFIHSLYGKNAIEKLKGDKGKQEEIIRDLDDRMSNSGNIEERLKTAMAKATLLSKISKASNVVNTKTEKGLIDLASNLNNLELSDSTKKLVNALFGDVEGGDVADTIKDSLTLYDVLENVSDLLKENGNKFPEGHEATSGDYAKQVLGAGAIKALVDTAIVETKDKTDAQIQEAKIEAVSDFITNPSSVTKFSNKDGGLAETMLGTKENPKAIQTILNAGGLGITVDKLLKSSKKE